MQKIITLIYVIAAAAVAVVTTILEMQPALLFIDIMAPEPGDSYSLTLALLLTFLVLILPMLLVLTVMYFIRQLGNQSNNIPLDATGVLVLRKRQLQSAMVGIPIFVNNAKSGVVDGGKMKFIDLRAGTFQIQAGEGKQASETLQITLAPGDQVRLQLEIKAVGLGLKYVLSQE